MSYARFAEDSDVYVYAADMGDETMRWCCCGCWLDQTGQASSVYFKTPDDMIIHLRRHEKAGHQVPDYAFERLQREAVLGYPDPVHEKQMRDLVTQAASHAQAAKAYKTTQSMIADGTIPF